MLYLRNSLSYSGIAVFAFISLLVFYGCADREELEEARREQSEGYNAEANEALKEAESAMREAGIEIDFSEQSGLESLTDLRAILPDPLEIKQLEKQQKMEEAIESLYTALDALGESDVSLAPGRVLTADPKRVSNTDLALLHLHLAYCYDLSAVSRLARAGTGPDGIYDTADDLYYISFSEEPQEEGPEIYTFMLTDRGQELMDAVDPDVDPYGYIKVFYREEQLEALQAIIDAIRLLTGDEVVVIENRAEGVGAHEPSVDERIYRSNASYHIDQTLSLAKKIAPGLEDALNELDEELDRFSKGISEKAVKWGFVVR